MTLLLSLCLRLHPILSLSLFIPQIGRYELATRHRLLLARDPKEPICPFTFSSVKELLLLYATTS